MNAEEAKRLRWFAESALNGFETLDLKTAVWLAQCELRDILRFLDRADNAVTKTLVHPIDSGVAVDLGAGNSNISDFSNSKIVWHGLFKRLKRILNLQTQD